MDLKGVLHRAKFLAAAIIMLWTMAGWPQILHSFPPLRKASAATFSMQTGYYMGTGATLAISGLGFQPQLVIVKADTTAGVGAVWKSSTMAANTTAFFPATANDTSTMITLGSDGFTVSSAANVNTVNVVWKWIAFAGSDCSATGVFCVGSYTGNGASQAVSSVGFQPDLVWVKGSTATNGGTWRSSSMGSNVGQFFTATTQNTSGGLFTTLNANGFTVGTTNSVSGTAYQYVAFKKNTGIVNVGTYSGDATDNRNITGVGFVPDFAFVKNANASTAVAPVFNTTDDYGDYSSGFADVANANDNIQGLQTDGFQVGTASAVNGSGNTMYYAAFTATANWSASGTFKMATGSYTGTGTTLPISGLGFTPNLVIIKDAAANYAVFRTSVMPGDSTAYFANAAANFTGGITSLDSDGFTLGTSTVTNTSSSTYTWEAFGNAWNPQTHAGAADFAIGAYTAGGIDNSNVTNNPFQPDLVAIKRSGATAATFRTSAETGDTSSFFAATAETSNNIQSLNTDGFQIGTAANVNTAANIYWWFAFKAGDNFAVNTYTGTGSTQNITSAGFQPDMVWVKRSTAVNGVLRSSPLAGDATQYFVNTANVTGRITGLVCNGFSLGGSQTETNTSGGTYRYIAWRAPSSILSTDIVDNSGCTVSSPSASMSAASVGFSCTTTTGTLGTASQKLRITNTTTNPAWSLTVAPTNGQSALWSSGSAFYDMNDPSGSPPGCSAGADTDTYAGQLSLSFSSATMTPKSGCATTGLSFGSNAGFNEGVANALTLATASSSAATSCYWDLQNIALSQRIPAAQPPGSYSLNLTVTLVAN